MMTSLNLTILDASAISSIGENLTKTAVAYAAGINRYQDSPLMSRSHNKPLKMATIPSEALTPLATDITEEFLLNGYQQKICSIAISTINSLKIPPGHTKKTLLLNTSESAATRQANNIIQAISKQTKIPFCPDTSAITHNGRAGALLALETAKQLIEAGKTHLVIIGGVDSWQGDMRRVEELDQKGRLLIAGSYEGFVPGEAGAFIAITVNADPTHSVLIVAGASETEQGHIDSQQVYKGEALSKAYAQALAAIPDINIDSLYSSLNGENYWAKEIGIALIRNNNFFNAKLSHYHPAESIGDAGAAAGAVLIALAFHQLKTLNQNILISASSDAGLRSAIILQQKR